MAGPWEKYQSTAVAPTDVQKPGKPWEKYSQSAAPASTPDASITPPPQGFLSSASDASGLSSVGNAILHPFTTAKNIGNAMLMGSAVDKDNPIVQGGNAMVDSTVQNAKQAGTYAKEHNFPGAVTSAVSAIPFAGPIIDKATDQYADKNYAGEAGTIFGGVGSIYGPKVLGEAASTVLKPAARSAAIGDVTRMIRPSTTDVAFGKSPAEGLLKQPGGVFAGSKESLLSRSSANLNKIGSQIGDAVKKAPQNPIDISDAVVNPIDDALAKAAARNEKGLFDSLQESKKGMTNDLFYDPQSESIAQRTGPKNLTAVTPSQLFETKRGLGDSIRWTNQAFENDLNAAKGDIYGNLKNKLNAAVPEVAPLNQEYGDLRAGISALEKRIPIENRNNAISLPDTVAAAGGMAAGHPGYAAAGLFAKKMINSTPLRTGLDNALFSYGSAPSKLTAAPSKLFYAPSSNRRQR
jgi:hypothetical protein